MSRRTAFSVAVLVLSLAFAGSLLAEEAQPAGKDAAKPATAKAGASKAGAAKPGDAKPDAPKNKDDKPTTPTYNYDVTITATRTEKDVFAVPNPVSVVRTEKLSEQGANGTADALRELPGVDVNGVGPSLALPVIRGQRGQRVLMLDDGTRINNSRRTGDFGDPLSTVDLSGVERIEIVRGPGSVLYGSDAIGGVINVVRERPPTGDASIAPHGAVDLRFNAAGSQKRGGVDIAGRELGIGYTIAATYRDSDAYSAPSGTFAGYTLQKDAVVNGTGVTDRDVKVGLDYPVFASSYLTFDYNRYRSKDGGFGYVDPLLYSEDPNITDIRYPYQDIDSLRLGFRGRELAHWWADHVNTNVYRRKNDRELDQVFTGPDFEGISINTTHVTTTGGRFEATKIVTPTNIVTYGVDYFKEQIEGTDRSSFFGSPFANSFKNPYSTVTSFGVFAQHDIRFLSRLSGIFGLRYQANRANADTTPGLDIAKYGKSKDTATVWAANLIYDATSQFKLLLNFGTAFRSPNAVERFFDGRITEMPGFYNVWNPNIGPERSFNVDAGFKVRTGNLYVEATYFRNRITDGIRLSETDETIVVNGRTYFVTRYQNVSALTTHGADVDLRWTVVPPLTIGLNYSRLRSEASVETVANSFADKANLSLRFAPPASRWWAEYHVRWNGAQKDLSDPLMFGGELPSFTVHALRAGVTLPAGRVQHRVVVGIDNLFNELYAEFSNASFFRPQPRRSVYANLTVAF